MSPSRKTGLGVRPPPRRSRAAIKQSQSAALARADGAADWVIGVGASAGGLEALTAFLRPLPHDLPAAVVIAQHMSHTHPSLLVQLLARETCLPVIEVADGVQPSAGVVYIAPPKHDVALRKNGFALLQPKRSRVPTPSVDDFFHSLAESRGGRAIGVVLSGTGSDGAAGLRAIRFRGGHTYAQDPESARYSGMPSAAIETGTVEGVLAADRIGEQILAFIRTGTSMATPVEEIEALSPLAKLFRMVKRRTGVDLAGYKSTTLKRRLARRLSATGAANLADYLATVEHSPEELDKLQQELLISVTGFFRDKYAFDALAQAITTLVQATPQDHQIRVWVAGCATGEEAYSIAILLLEALRLKPGALRPRLFATDIDMPALQHARRGIYSARAVSKVKPEWVERYFDRIEGSYEIKAAVRDCVTFARHDITAHPPFLRSDLVSCRNLLIYFEPELQAKVLPVLHYALVQGGLFFVGKSESVSHCEDLFEIVDKTARLFRSRGPRLVPTPTTQEISQADRVVRAPSLSEQISTDHTRLALERYAPPSVLVNREGMIIHTLGQIGRYLVFPTGKPVLNIARLVREDARTEVQALLHRAVRDRKSVSGRTYADAKDGAFRMTVEPVTAAKTECFLIAFEDMAELARLSGEQVADAPGRAERMLQDELGALRESLQTVIEELETQNEEMQALNEELQSANEELQSTNEELETSNEELQSTNEELSTVNDELEQKSREVAEANSDLLALLESLPFPATVFDDALHVSRSNAAAVRMFNMPRPAGISLAEIEFPPELAGVRDDLHEVIRSHVSRESQISVGGRHYKLVISPCALPSRNATGAVLQLVDVSGLVRTQMDLRISQTRLAAVLDNSSMGVMIADVRGKIEHANQRFLQDLGISAPEAARHAFWDLYTSDDAKMLRQRHVAALATESAFQADDAVSRLGKQRFLHSVWISLRDERGTATGVCWMSLDITDQHDATQALARSEALNRAVLTGMPAVLAVLDGSGRIVSVNEAWHQFARANGGRSDTMWVGQNYLDFCRSTEEPTGEGRRAHDGVLEVLQGKVACLELEYPCHSPEKERWFRMLVVPLDLPSGGAVVMHIDVTAVRKARSALELANAHLDETVEARTRELRQAVDELEMFMHTVSHDLRTPLRTLVGFTELVRSNVGESVDAQTADYLDRISRAATRMNGYLDELLKLSHLTRGDILVKEVDVSRMAREIGGDLAMRAPQRRVDFQVADGLKVEGDPNLLRGVFENLLSNAWKYTRLRDPARIEVGCTVRGGRQALYVRDNGIGFDMSYRDKLFMPFQRLHPQGEYEGSGLGLAAARRIVVKHGGSIEAEGRPDFGATFYIMLP